VDTIFEKSAKRVCVQGRGYAAINELLERLMSCGAAD